MPPAARVTDMHVCPMVTGIVPHVGGPIIPPCSLNVITGFMPQARVTDMCVCVGPPDVIVKGSPTVLVNGLMAARIGDMTAHGGNIVTGFPSVLIGEAGGGGSAGGSLTVVNLPAAAAPALDTNALPPLRQEYEAAVRDLAKKGEAMKQADHSPEEIARTLHADRRALGVKYKALTPPAKLAEIYERNQRDYGDKLGPSIEWLRNKGKTWEQIIESASRPGGKDLKF
jgi:uncharacterized Zn-binding protein involved in type VI secretion